jgi:hypothetical protein
MINHFRAWQARVPVWKRAIVDGLSWGVGTGLFLYLLEPRLRSILLGLGGGVLFGLSMWVLLTYRANRP